MSDLKHEEDLISYAPYQVKCKADCAACAAQGRISELEGKLAAAEAKAEKWALAEGKQTGASIHIQVEMLSEIQGRDIKIQELEAQLPMKCGHARKFYMVEGDDGDRDACSECERIRELK